MAINATDFLAALEEIEASKGIGKDLVLHALEEALIKGYKKQLGGDDADVRVNIDSEKGIIEMFNVKEVVNEVEDDFLQVSVEEANQLDPSKNYADGDEFFIPATIEELKKATAMSVKSILKQKFAEAEKNALYEAFKDKIGTMITGNVEKVDEKGISVNITKTSVYLPRKELIGDERFKLGEQVKIYVHDVASGPKGAHIVVSRANEGFLRCLFEDEIHEIYDGTIEIKSISREAGERSKVAVYTKDPNVDPAGACIGQNGSRIQKIVGQLGNNGAGKEKIDIIAWNENPGLYIMESLKPAHVVGITVDKDSKKATAIVKDDSLSLAIGRRGVNARLAVKLTGYQIDIKTETEAYEENIAFQSFEELQALDIEEKARKAMLESAKQVEEVAMDTVLPGLPEGYVAPQQRIYEEDNDTDDLKQALEEEAENNEVIETVIEPVVEVKEEKVVKEEALVVEEERREVKTTTSLEELEKNLASESSRNKKGNAKKSYKKNKKSDDEEGGDDNGVATNTSNGERMSIYTEEELRQMEEEEAMESIEEDDDIDYDEYDDYYDDDNR